LVGLTRLSLPAPGIWAQTGPGGRPQRSVREVTAMGLTWRDLVSSVIAMLMVVVYALFAFGTSMPLLSSAWAASGVELALGAACAVLAAADLHTRPQPKPGVIVRRITTVLGTIALLAGLAGLAADSTYAVEILVVVTIFLWLATFIWHVVGIGAQPPASSEGP
jgi:hypothetical protein